MNTCPTFWSILDQVGDAALMREVVPDILDDERVGRRLTHISHDEAVPLQPEGSQDGLVLLGAAPTQVNGRHLCPEHTELGE